MEKEVPGRGRRGVPRWRRGFRLGKDRSKHRFGLSVYRCVAAGVKPKTTVRERRDGSGVIPHTPSHVCEQMNMAVSVFGAGLHLIFILTEEKVATGVLAPDLDR